MPASSAESFDPIEQSLHASLDGAGRDAVAAGSSVDFDEQLLSSAKKVLLSKVEFEPAENEYSLTLQNLKAKYIHLNPSDGNHTNSLPKANSVAEMNGNCSGGVDGRLSNHTSSRLEEDGIPMPNVMIHPPTKVKLGWQRIYRIGAGLANLGNTCFLNATLQCLTYTPPLVNHLIEFDEHVTNCKTVGFCMMCELYRHIRRALEKNGETIKPQCILQKLKAIAKHMVWGRQEDAHEFLRYVMESMIKSSLKGHSPATLDRISLETTVVNHIFGGYHRSQVICLRCKEKSDTYDHFMDIILDIKSVPSLEKAMEKFVQPEILDNENAYMCPRCKRKCPAQKRFTVHRSPNIATFQLKRFDYNRMVGGKITKHITFPEKLDMRPFMSQRQGPPVIFQLYAVLVHQGVSCNSGHYFCFVRNSNNLWYSMDDCKVRQVALNVVLSQQAYLLFYTRVPNNPSPVTKSSSTHQTSTNSIHSVSSMNGTMSHPSLDTRGLSAVKKPVVGALNNNNAKSKPLSSVSMSLGVKRPSPASSPSLSSNLIPLPISRERVSFGLKPLGVQTQQHSQKSIPSPQPLLSPKAAVTPTVVTTATTAGTLVTTTTSPVAADEMDPKHPRIVMHIKNGKVTSTEKTWATGDGAPTGEEDSERLQPTVATCSGRVPNLVPYIPDSSEESDQENKNRSFVQTTTAMSVASPRLVSPCAATPKNSQEPAHGGNQLLGKTKPVISERTPGDSTKPTTGIGSTFVNDTGAKLSPVREKGNPLAVMIASPSGKLKATSPWVVTDGCQESPSLASEGSNNSINSTTDWTVTGRERGDETPKSERHCPGWIVTPRGLDKRSAKASLFSRSQSSCPDDRVRYYDDNDKLLNCRRHVPNIIRYHSDTETHKRRRAGNKDMYYERKECDTFKSERPTTFIHEYNRTPKVKHRTKMEELGAVSDKVALSKRTAATLLSNGSFNSQDSDVKVVTASTGKNVRCPLAPEVVSRQILNVEAAADRTAIKPLNDDVSTDHKCRGKAAPDCRALTQEDAECGDSVSDSDGPRLVNGHRSESSLDSGHSSPKKYKKHKKIRRNREGSPEGHPTPPHPSEEESSHSDESSAKLKRRKKKHKRHQDGRDIHRHRHSSSSSSSDYELEWVERTKETVEQERLQTQVPVKLWDEGVNDGYKRVLLSNCENNDSFKRVANNTHSAGRGALGDACWDGRRHSNVVTELLKESGRGYGAKVNSWDGGQNLVDREIAADTFRFGGRKRRYSDDYDEEYDSGRMKKFKFNKRQYSDSSLTYNPFQRVQDVRYDQDKYHQNNNMSGHQFCKKQYHYSSGNGNHFKGGGSHYGSNNSMCQRNQYFDSSKPKYHTFHKF